MQVVVCDQERRAEIILQKRYSCPSLRFIVLMEEPSDTLKRKAYDSNIELIMMDTLETMGALARNRLPPLSPVVKVWTISTGLQV